LIDADITTTAGQMGLFHYTSTTNALSKEGNSWLNPGYHYIALDANNNPLDSDGDGTPNYIEDANGNGSLDSGETSFASPVITLNSSALAYTERQPALSIDTAATLTDEETLD